MKSRPTAKCLQKRAFPQHGRIPRALLLVLGPMALGVGLYGLAGSYGGPWLVDHWLAQYQAAAPGRATLRETVSFNPFTLVAEVVGLEARDEAGAAFAADALVVDLSAKSLAELRPVVSSVVIEGPRIALASVADLRALGTALDRMRVDRLEVTGGTFALGLGADRPVEFARFDLSLTGFDGLSGAPGRFSLDAVTPAEASITSDGALAANLERADGQLHLGAIGLGAIAARIGGIVGSVEPHGLVDLSADFSATSLLTVPALELTRASLVLSELSLTPADDIAVTADRVAATASLLLAATEDGIDVSGRIEVDRARLSVHDERVVPPQAFAFDDAAVVIAADTDADGLSLTLGGRPRGVGEVTLRVLVPPAATAERRVSIEAARLPATKLSAYAVDALGRELAEGNADLGLEYSLSGNRVEGSLRIVARELAFATGTADPAPKVGGPALELAVALLENPDRIIELDLPFGVHIGTVRDAVTAALNVRLTALTQAPFETLASLMDGAAEATNVIPFLPGDAALNDRALASIVRLADALNARPRLAMRVHGGYDPTVDRDALARQQIELHVQLATAGPNAQARPTPVDLDSARARDVLDEFARERLPTERMEELAGRFDCRGASLPVCEHAYYEQIFDALVANEEITSTALNRLGRFRAQSVVDALREHGIADERIEIVTGSDVVEAPFGIDLWVEVTAADSQFWPAGHRRESYAEH